MPTPKSTQLVDTFANLARELEAIAGLEETRHCITRFAVEHVPGCAYAAISVPRRNGGVSTAAATDDIAHQITKIQHETGEGPGLTALTDHNIVVAVDDLRHDQRWPTFTHLATSETPIASTLSFRLFTAERTTGVLNLYADQPHMFDARSRTVGTALAAHAATALTCAQEHQRAENLEAALETNRTIGIAIGIVMHTTRLDRDRAFNFLVDASQRLNTKLHDIADVVAETGELPGELHGRVERQ